MGFDDIIGHQKQLATLRAALGNGRLHHAYLFLGPEGVGKRLTALALAKALHCTVVQNDYCGNCTNCRRVNDGNHPDVRLIEAVSAKKEISIQQVRELERQLNYRSFTGQRKIAIIDPATSLNLSSQNALLKTLEEPPQNSLIILIAANEGALLPTLRSRCLRLSFTPLSREEIAGYLQARAGISKNEADCLAALSMGSMGAALALKNADLSENRKTWTGMLGAFKKRDYRAAMMVAETLAANRDDTIAFLNWAESWYRDLVIANLAQTTDECVNLDMRQEIEKQTSQIGIEPALSALAQIATARTEIQRNLNRRMVLEKVLFGIVEER